VFHGATELSLDPKGRLSIPTRLRDGLASDGASVFLTAHVDGCLLLYPRAAFEQVHAQITALPDSSETARWWKRMVVGYAEELHLDSSGRILISPSLRKFAALDRNATLVGQGSHFELWDTSTWDEKVEKARALASSSPQSFSLSL
jgi:MraZ protein